MSSNNDNAAAAVIAFVSGAVIGGIAALLLTPKTGDEMREKLSVLGESTSDKIRTLAREARFRASCRSKGGDLKYDGGDGWV